MLRPRIFKWVIATILLVSMVVTCVNVWKNFPSQKPLSTHLNSEISRELPTLPTEPIKSQHATAVEKTQEIHSQRLNKDILEELRRQQNVNRVMDLGTNGIKTPRNESFAKVKRHAVAYLEYEEVLHNQNDIQFHPGQEVVFNQSEHILLVSTWRSGSTFLGELLNQIPGTFYNFEPLIFFDRQGLKPTPEMANDLINDLSHCRTSQEFLDSSSDLANEFTISRNFRPWDACQFMRLRGTDENFCFNATLYNELCQLYPRKLVKTVRGKLVDLKSLLTDERFQDLAANLKVVVLVRDPRGIMNSRFHVDWCKDECLDEAELCRTLESNFDEARLLAQKYPDRIYFLRYEDLCLMPEKHVVSLFRFLGRSITRPIKKYTVLHMSTKDLDPHGTRRKAKVQALQWTKEMPISDIHRVESQCQGFMKKAGYIGFHHSSEWTDEYQFLAPDSTVWNYTESNQHWFLD